ncbi:MAG: protein nirG [Burkholderiales bacterium RIFCSPLOWO2_12_67_14]|nr:MAG: protein nirG [Burkholderiales bacterium RIFCSPLOWO2_02_FULL_67_64]OGB39707.1 MAG: protein nirG [Burkholderiales bacterium RIFCSPLOWO2_12_67_14]OGB50355.1 MAG: protein nirG [Burkholderiales bacterium RIFCSPHIGHO2_12_FULL_67_38]OGB98577.1 MAG: protein nirG [Burkholderiales bacterium RIFCSPLOWO2_12_FULL_67_210]
MLSLDDARLVGFLHGGFPLSDRPFADVAAQLGCSEDAVIQRLQRLLSQGDLTRFGPLFQIERAGGRFVLAAMAVPEERFDAVAKQLDGMAEVAHNYRRESAHPGQPGATPLNMWFVLAVESAEQIDPVVARIEAATALPVYAFPKEREFFVELKLPLFEGGAHGPR